MKIEDITHNIVVYRNVLENPKAILELIENIAEGWDQGGVAASRYKDYADEGPIRDVSVKYVPFETSENDSDDVKAISKILNESFDKCESEYISSRPMSLTSHEGYQVVKYTAGQYFKDHADATEEFPRKLSTVYYFNDDYEGGEIFFSNLGITIKPESNSMIVFPSSEEYRHTANVIKSGTKYAIVGFWR